MALETPDMVRAAMVFVYDEFAPLGEHFTMKSSVGIQRKVSEVPFGGSYLAAFELQQPLSRDEAVVQTSWVAVNGDGAGGLASVELLAFITPLQNDPPPEVAALADHLLALTELGSTQFVQGSVLVLGLPRSET